MVERLLKRIRTRTELVERIIKNWNRFFWCKAGLLHLFSAIVSVTLRSRMRIWKKTLPQPQGPPAMWREAEHLPVQGNRDQLHMVISENQRIFATKNNCHNHKLELIPNQLFVIWRRSSQGVKQKTLECFAHVQTVSLILMVFWSTNTRKYSHLGK